jgi:trehalose synthase-fused probable maltokinase
MDQDRETTTGAPWSSVLEGAGKARIEALLPDYLRARRWFSAKARRIAQVRLAGAIPFTPRPDAPPLAYLSFVEVTYAEGDTQTFVLPLAFAAGADATQIEQAMPQAVIAAIDVAGEPRGILYDASWGQAFATALLAAIGQDRRFGDATLAVHAWPTAVFNPILAADHAPLTPRLVGAEQSNTSIIYGDQFILKLFRRLEQGTSPDLEIGRFLTDRHFAHTPPLAGAVEQVTADHEPVTLAILQGFVPNQGDAWSYTLEALDPYYAWAVGAPAAPAAPPPPAPGHLLDHAGAAPPPPLRDAIGPYLASAELLGRRTAELHRALAADPADPAFAPVPLTLPDQLALFESVRQLLDTACRLLTDHLPALPAAARPQAEAVLAQRDAILARFDGLRKRELAALRTRVHGDYHLGQVLYTGQDFVIIDFEGEPLRSLAERRQKHSPLKDVAGMLRSFHYAAYAALFRRQGAPEADTPAPDEGWAGAWYEQVGARFLGEYLQVAAPGGFLPQARADLQMLLDAYLLEKAVYELIYELNNRPDWVRIPLQGIEQLAR